MALSGVFIIKNKRIYNIKVIYPLWAMLCLTADLKSMTSL